MKLISWNVNGIRAIIKKNFYEFVNSEKPDVLCLQETKARPEQVDLMLLDYPYKYWNSAEKKGYSGTAVFSKVEPYAVIYDMGIEEHDQEGRVISLEYEDFFLVNVYTPNSKDMLARIDYRVEWDNAFRNFIMDLDKKKPVVICGDLNAAHKEIDLKNSKPNMTTATKLGSPGFSDREREGMTKHLEAGLVDSFRHFYPDKEDAYSWWSYRMGARSRNVGWRIDYFLVSQKMIGKLKSAKILPEILGSDHCPVEIEL